MRTRYPLLSLGLAVSLLCADAAHAAGYGDQAAPPPNNGQHSPGPPREAIEACAGKKAGDAVNFAARDGRIVKGVCQLVAIPERPAPQK